MGLNLNPIFITNQAFISDEVLLDKMKITNLKKGKAVNFYDTNNQWDTLFIGNKDNCKILCEGGMARQAFNENNPFLEFKESEVAAIIWNEVSDMFGFSLMKNGVITRRLLFSAGELRYNDGKPLPEELAIKIDEIFGAKEKQAIIQAQGQNAFDTMLIAEIVCTATNDLAKRYLGTGIVDNKELIEFREYEEE